MFINAPQDSFLQATYTLVQMQAFLRPMPSGPRRRQGKSHCIFISIHFTIPTACL
uniref:Uncharacterized protein n=1 Tax=Meloidogyne incognita TaxID=6306 RepID=A0A914N7G1_MELIC